MTETKPDLLPDVIYAWTVPSGFKAWSNAPRVKGQSTKYVRADRPQPEPVAVDAIINQAHHDLKYDMLMTSPSEMLGKVIKYLASRNLLKGIEK